MRQQMTGVFSEKDIAGVEAATPMFVHIAHFVLIRLKIDQLGMSCTPDDFMTHWTAGFFAACEDAGMSEGESNALWEEFTRVFKLYRARWMVLEPDEINRFGLPFWTQAMFADQFVPPRHDYTQQEKEAHKRIFDGAGFIMKDFQEILSDAFESHRIMTAVD